MSWSNFISSFRFCVTSLALNIDEVCSSERIPMLAVGCTKSYIGCSCEDATVFDKFTDIFL